MNTTDTIPEYQRIFNELWPEVCCELAADYTERQWSAADVIERIRRDHRHDWEELRLEALRVLQEEYDERTEQEVRASAIAVERARIDAILGCEEAKGRERLARRLALKTDMTAEAAREFLLDVEQQAVAQPKEPQPDQFTAHMRRLANPRVGVETERRMMRLLKWRGSSRTCPASQRRRAAP